MSRTARSREENSRRGRGLQPQHLPALLAEAFDDADAGHVLLDDTGDDAGLLLRVPRRREQPGPAAERDEAEQRADCEGDEGEQRGEEEHHHERGDEQQQVAGHVRQEGHQALHEGDVARGAADELARRELVLPHPVEPLQRAEQVVAQVVLHVEGQPAADVATDEAEPELRQAEADQRDRERQQRVRPDG